MYIDEELKDLSSEPEQWLCSLFGAYANNLLRVRYPDLDDDGKTPKPVNTAVRVSSICYDGRRDNTVRKTLKDYIVDGHDNLTVDHYKFMAEAPKYAKKPVFDASGKKNTNMLGYMLGSCVNKTLDNVYEGFKDVSSLGLRESIYVYFNQDQYDYKIVEHAREYTNKRYPYGRKIINYVHRLYPKKYVGDLSDSIFHNKVQDFMENNAQEVMEMYGVSPKYLYDIEHEYTDRTHKRPHVSLKIVSYKEKDITKKMLAMAYAIRVYRRSLRELYQFREAVRAAGDDDVSMVKRMADHLRMEAPLHINDENDPIWKDLAIQLLSGKEVKAPSMDKVV